MSERPGKIKKPNLVIDKERARRAAASETVWLFGLHVMPWQIPSARNCGWW